LYFNYELAKEMGLISQDHPHRLYKKLEEAILDTFSIQIINEYDLKHQTKFPELDLRPKKYMATRYLQLQHPSKTGKTSGDGRSIWNGQVKDPKGQYWDVSSCGTGATCLSPATAKTGKYFKSGDPSISYGCGYAEVLDGVTAAIFSEIFHRNNIATERSLAVIEFKGDLSIYIRAGHNLIRPSHLFNHLKQGNYERLKAATDYYIDRQIKNKIWKNLNSIKNKYQFLLQKVTETFARTTARFENDYIFCWLDWDGDNVLMDGGIIDYGSVRQFGLFHHEYRYDDDDRWSTTILEQKSKARYIVQCFIQLTDFLINQKKKNIKQFSNHPMLNEFDRLYEENRTKMFVKKLGHPNNIIQKLLLNDKKPIDQLFKVFSAFEKTTTERGLREVEDGITEDAIFCMRDILRELPRQFYKKESPLGAAHFLEIIKSSYAEKLGIKLNPTMEKRIEKFQNLYFHLLKKAQKYYSGSREKFYQELIWRNDVINRYERVTGDSIIHIANELMESKDELTIHQLNKLIEDFIDDQVIIPEKKNRLQTDSKLDKKLKGLKEQLIDIVKDFSEGI
jgi:uncharacterized protein YdiU (UPF0061 family)